MNKIYEKHVKHSQRYRKRDRDDIVKSEKAAFFHRGGGSKRLHRRIATARRVVRLVIEAEDAALLPLAAIAKAKPAPMGLKRG